MRFVIFSFLIIFSTLCFAHEIKCYSKGQNVYHHQVHNITFLENLTMFDENNSKKSVITNLDCIAKIEGRPE